MILKILVLCVMNLMLKTKTLCLMKLMLVIKDLCLMKGLNGVKKNDCDTDKLPRKRTKLPRKTHIEQPQTERKHYRY